VLPAALHRQVQRALDRPAELEVVEDDVRQRQPRAERAERDRVELRETKWSHFRRPSTHGEDHRLDVLADPRLRDLDLTILGD